MLGLCSLFIPASSPRMINAGLSLSPDSLVFDLEDGVSPAEKDSARDLLRLALPLFSGMSVAVRINCRESCWEEDLFYLACRPEVGMIVVPKADAEFLAAVGARLDELASPAGIAALIESAASLDALDSLVMTSPRLKALLFGAEDFCADMGVSRSLTGEEILYARNRICAKARACGLEALDTPFPGTDNTEALEADASLAGKLGFTGKLCISPHHIPVIRRAFLPSAAEAAWAERVIAAAREAEELGKGAVSLDNAMIDKPVALRAERILRLWQSRGWEQ